MFQIEQVCKGDLCLQPLPEYFWKSSPNVQARINLSSVAYFKEKNTR